MKKFALKTRLRALLLLPLALAAHGLLPSTRAAMLGAYDGNVVLSHGGGAEAYYWADQANGGLSQFSGNLFTINQGQSIKLGGEMRTYPGLGDVIGADWARIYYQVDGSAFSFVNLPFKDNVDLFNDRWQEAGAGMVEIGSSLAVGLHHLTVYFQAHDNTLNADTYISNSGANFTADITVVPEPVSLALGIFGVLVIAVFGFRRRFSSVSALE